MITAADATTNTTTLLYLLVKFLWSYFVVVILVTCPVFIV